MKRLVPCTTCQRHVRDAEAACPFCSASRWRLPIAVLALSAVACDSTPAQSPAPTPSAVATPSTAPTPSESTTPSAQLPAPAIAIYRLEDLPRITLPPERHMVAIYGAPPPPRKPKPKARPE